MALFRKKGRDEAGEPASEGGAPAATEGNGEAPVYSPEKAARFFEHAKTVAETGNHEYAMQLWLSGLRQDPTSMEAMEAFFRSAGIVAGGDKPAKSGREAAKAVEGRGPVERYLQALLAWGLNPMDAAAAVRAVEAAVKLDLGEQAYWMGERALAIAQRDKKPRKDLLVKLMESLAAVQAYPLAVKAGEAAKQLDPSDGELAARVRNMSAAETMTRGGFDETGQAGGFRKNVKDIEKQRLMEDADRVSKTEETIDRLIEAAEADYARRPEDMYVVQTLTKRLLERGRDEDEQRALRLLMKAYEETRSFRFRQEAGRIQVRRARRALVKYRDAAEANPNDPEARARYEEAERKFLEMEVTELLAAVEAYPTDLSLKYELGKRHFALKDYEKAIPLLQEAKGDPRFRAHALGQLGHAFQAIDFVDEAITTFRQAIEAHRSTSDETGMELRYGLMAALQAKAEHERDLVAAEEAEKLASAIAIEQFGYRDVRQRREQLKKLVVELRQGAGA
ncbi:MAG: hypothetical protein DYG93_00990 [Leptolyngbya sp. PLA2]|nr:hypothetical protein [Leptolyngbya sp. PL-A2]MCQ3941376.1 hypothetical protein [cyanobacterium CYA1]MCZ7632919.1 hypothetical protein [Phycisphaerales bacterium]MDL1904487.1 hypothetical protein [Synechococcales cyanobacterium CNB]GIK19007.1 MAG: hypothetical protein BroJett004_11710 [Planctomycetota bacterium]